MRYGFIRFSVLGLFSLTIVGWLTPSARAILAEVTLTELTHMTDHVVRAKVLSKRSDWNDAHNQILTTVILQVDETYAGKLADSSQTLVVVPGGVVDGMAMEVEHAPVFEIGEDVFVFLTNIDDKRCRVSGWEAGKFTLENSHIVENGLLGTEFLRQIETAIKTAGKN